MSQNHDIQIGNIFTHSWGYDQTNIDFYQVVKATPKTVIVRKIGEETVPGSDAGFMCDRVLPKPFTFTGELLRKRPYLWRDEWHLSMGYGSASPWDGEPESRSWYC